MVCGESVSVTRSFVLRRWCWGCFLYVVEMHVVECVKVWTLLSGYLMCRHRVVLFASGLVEVCYSRVSGLQW